MPIKENESTLSPQWGIRFVLLISQLQSCIVDCFLSRFMWHIAGMRDIWEAYTPVWGFVNLKELLSRGLHSWDHLNCSERVINSCFKRSSYCIRIDKSLEYLLTTERCMFRLLIVLGCGWTTPSLGLGLRQEFLIHKHKTEGLLLRV